MLRPCQYIEYLSYLHPFFGQVNINWMDKYWIGFLILHGLSLYQKFILYQKYRIYVENGHPCPPPPCPNVLHWDWRGGQELRVAGGYGTCVVLPAPNQVGRDGPSPSFASKFISLLTNIGVFFFVWWKIKSIALIANNIVLINLLSTIWISINLVCYDKYFWSR